MDITRETFHSVAPAVAEYIRTCDFYSVDTELTGINMNDLMGSGLDTPERHFYIKARTAMRYALIQFGICTFHRIPAGAKRDEGSKVVSVGGVEFEARPFNFFLFPSTQPNGDYLGRSLERDLVMSPSSISFNRKHGMNFQKWITQGVEYCNTEQEQGIIELIKQEEDMEEDKRAACSSLEKALGILASPEEKDYLTKCAKMADKFVKESTAKEFMMPAPPSKAAGDAIKFFVEGQFPDRFTVAPKGRFPNRCPTITRMSEDEAELYKSRLAVAKGRRVTDFVGFRSLYKTMVECKKPLIGHSFLADVLFTIAAFDEDLGGAELCRSKKAILDKFPMIFDTKAISFDERYFPMKRFPHRSLENLSEYYTVSPASPHLKVSLPLGFQNYEQETLMKAKQSGVPSAAHEAGYDALMTGFLWLNLLAEAKVLDVTKFTPESSEAAFDEFMEKAKVEFGNKIYLHRSLYTMDLASTNEERERLVEGGGNDVFNAANDGVLYLTYPKTMAAYDVESKIQGLGFPGVVLEIDAGVSVMKLEKSKCAVVEGKALNEVASDAIGESSLGRLVKAHPFVPYHLRPKPENLQPGDASAPDAPSATFKPLPADLCTRPLNYTAISYCSSPTTNQTRGLASLAAASHMHRNFAIRNPTSGFGKLTLPTMARFMFQRR